MNEVNVIEAGKLTDSPSIAIVVSKYNYYIAERLLTGCLSTLKSEGINNQSITTENSALASGAKGYGFYSLMAYKHKRFKNNKKDPENQPLRATPYNAK